MGITPVRKSIHLVLGGAVHAGNEVLLREGQKWIDDVNPVFGATHENKVEMLFEGVSPGPDGAAMKNIRFIEDRAVVAALEDLAASTQQGVELDSQEQGGGNAGKVPDSGAGSDRNLHRAGVVEESPIAVTFDDADLKEFYATTNAINATTKVPAMAGVTNAQPGVDGNDARGGDVASAGVALGASLADDFATPRYADDSQARTADEDRRLAEIQVKCEENASGIDSYLREELAALVEGIVRAYARRRLRPLLTEYEVLEVEREGSWHLTDAWLPDDRLEIWFASRADALLRERSTGYLYIMSFKTTGSWDRRRAMDAEVDMQGLSEAVDIDRRLAEAWALARRAVTDGPFTQRDLDAMFKLVSEPTFKWLAQLLEPPRVLGIRYEYILKGPRMQDKHDPDVPNRYVQHSPLIRAYKFEGVTSDERKFAHSYTVHDLSGKARNLDWRSWKKSPVWRYMSIAQWIDMLDRGDVQPDAYNAEGYPYDILADQFIPPVIVYRNEDDMRDMLEQIESSETRVAVDVAAVRAVADNPAQFRSELNRRFPQSRHACSYPGACAFRPVCYAGAGSDLREHPEHSELYTIRIPNHPQEIQHD